jgi:hypothetical protein
MLAYTSIITRYNYILNRESIYLPGAYAHLYNPDGSDPWIPAMKEDTISTNYSLIRHIIIGIVIPAGIAFLILLAIPMNTLTENLFWIALAALGIVVVSGFATLKKK